MLQPAFQHLGLRIEAGDRVHPFRLRIIGLLRNQPDDLALGRDCAMVGASSRTAAWIWRIGVARKSVIFMLTCARPFTLTPIAFTPCMPPPDARMARAMARAAAMSRLRHRGQPARR